MFVPFVYLSMVVCMHGAVEIYIYIYNQTEIQLFLRTMGLISGLGNARAFETRHSRWFLREAEIG